MSQSDDVSDRQARAAKTQSLFREVNERVREMNDQFNVLVPVSDWVCECANDRCFERIALARQDYEHIRATSTRFLVAAGDEHIWPDVDRIVERRDDYWIVEKTGRGAALAQQEDLLRRSTNKAR